MDDTIDSIPPPTLFKFTNAAQSEMLDSILAMFYQGVMANTIGIMQAWNLEKEEEELILVGIQLDEDGKADCYPLATILKAENVRNYLAPDGEGEYYDPLDAVESARVKEKMKSFEEAVIAPHDTIN